MAQSPIGMGEQDQAERDRFENELKRIIEASNKAGLMLRVIGSLAFQMHCPKYGYIQAAMGRAYTDIDFAGYRKQAKEIRVLMAGLGYQEDQDHNSCANSHADEGQRSALGIPPRLNRLG